MSCFAGFEPICRAEVALDAYTWYGLGGVARWFAQPRDEAELAALLRRCREHGIAWRVLGRGANLLVRDGRLDALVLRLGGDHFDSVAVDGTSVFAGAAADFPKLIRKALQHGLTGLESLAGIPGSLGGVVRMNAGGKYGEIGAHVREVRVLRADGEFATLSAERVNFRYRRTDLADCIVLGARLELHLGDAEQALLRHRDVWNEKSATQPAVAERSCGCIFKNPPGGSAGRLVDAAGLKGQRVGGAEISARHANFIVARNGATAQHVLDLIALAKDRVRATSGIELELEVEIW